MSEVKWGLGFRNGKTLIRCRDASGKPFASVDRGLALDFLVRWYRNDKTMRLVKLTPSKKGWRPASEPPIKHENYVLVATESSRCVTDQHVARYIDKGWWTACGEKVELVTHWRPLPKGPK